MFQLTKTVNQQTYESSEENTTPLLKLAADDHRHFVLEHRPKRRRSSGTSELAPEIAQMIQQHLNLSSTSSEPQQTRKRKPSKKHFVGAAAEVVTTPSTDYVYDIYHLESVPENQFNDYKEDTEVGFVKIIYADIDLVPDGDSEADQRPPSDDEDSNEENYYRNDYPEDEDDDRSVLFGSEGEEIPIHETEVKEQTDSYDALFDLLGNNTNILSSLNAGNFVDLDADDEGDDMGQLDQNDDSDVLEEDPDADSLTIYRDRIFGELQAMIDRS